MNKKLLFSTLGLMAFTLLAKAQFTNSDLQYYVGSGSDTAVLVIDFKDGTQDSSYAWGYLFDGNKTGEDMLNAVAQADENFTVSISSGFLNDITYNSHAGIGGMPDYWSTWSGTDTASLTMNSGIGKPITNGDWFACSYTDFNPALKPGNPIPAFDPSAFLAADVRSWFGTGSDSAILVVDFLDGTASSSYAWGYLFTDSTDGATMLSDIAQADSQLSVNASAFLNDITYQSHSGIGNMPNFWGTWSATNLGNWSMNIGIGTVVKNGDFFGCAYTDFAPALRPGRPFPVNYSRVGLGEQDNLDYNIYPNPASDWLTVTSPTNENITAILYSGNGKKLMEERDSGTLTLDVSHLPKGVYLLSINNQMEKVLLQ